MSTITPTITTDRRRMISRTAVIVAALHTAGWGGLLAVTAFDGSSAATVLGLGATAYVLGLRHAFDPDHIAAIDSTTRRLVAEARDSRSVGLWFSLGHSTVVAVLAGLVIAGVRAASDTVADEHSGVRDALGTWGTLFSTTFLTLTAVITLRAMRDNGSGQHGLGIVWRLLGRSAGMVRRPVHMWAVGLLFGLGFDTATEVGLLSVTGSVSLRGAPVWLLMSLPIVFAAGMSALDSAQGATARHALHVGSGRPGVYTTLMTCITTGAALAIAAKQLLDLFGIDLPGSGPFDELGFVLTGALVIMWGVGAILTRRRVYRHRG